MRVRHDAEFFHERGWLPFQYGFEDGDERKSRFLRIGKDGEAEVVEEVSKEGFGDLSLEFGEGMCSDEL